MFRVVLFTVSGAAAGVLTAWYVFGFAPLDSIIAEPWRRLVAALTIGCLPGAMLGAIFGTASALLSEARALRREIAATRSNTV